MLKTIEFVAKLLHIYICIYMYIVFFAIAIVLMRAMKKLENKIIAFDLEKLSLRYI